MGTLFEEMVTEQLLTGGQKEKKLAIQQGNYNDDKSPSNNSCGWSKQAPGHSYYANSGIEMISDIGLLFIGVRSKYCFIVPSITGEEYQCHIKSASGSSCSMEADIILERFQ